MRKLFSIWLMDSPLLPRSFVNGDGGIDAIRPALRFPPPPSTSERSGRPAKRHERGVSPHRGALPHHGSPNGGNMSADLGVVAALALLTGLLLTAHVVIVAGLITRRPRWPALLALVAPPAAPILAHRAGLRVRAYLWLFAAVAYVVVQLTFRH